MQINHWNHECINLYFISFYRFIFIFISIYRLRLPVGRYCIIHYWKLLLLLRECDAAGYLRKLVSLVYHLFHKTVARQKRKRKKNWVRQYFF